MNAVCPRSYLESVSTSPVGAHPAPVHHLDAKLHTCLPGTVHMPFMDGLGSCFGRMASSIAQFGGPCAKQFACTGQAPDTYSSLPSTAELRGCRQHCYSVVPLLTTPGCSSLQRCTGTHQALSPAAVTFSTLHTLCGYPVFAAMNIRQEACASAAAMLDARIVLGD